MKRNFLITENEKKRILEMHNHSKNTKKINESYDYGLIQEGDELCDIICKRKIAAYGSNGDVVKEIQHALSKCGYNIKYEGGGMNTGCAKDKNDCDGKFRQHTRDAVKEFQKANGLIVDGKVGYNTLKALEEEGCIDLPECKCDEYNDDEENNNQNNNQNNLLSNDEQKKLIDNIDCNKLKECVYDKLFKGDVSPKDRILNLKTCLGIGGYGDIDAGKMAQLDAKSGYLSQCQWYIPTLTEKGEYIMSCPKTLNCQNGIDRDMRYCNSKFIKACEKAKCTQIYY